MSSIVQGTPEWLEAKQKTIGASEVYALVHHYCKKDLQDLGIELPKELPFRTIQELFLKIKFDAKLSDIDPICSEFGNGMESYIAYRLGQELPQLKIERSKEFIINEKLHSLAACSPDGYIELEQFVVGEFNYTWDVSPASLTDFDKTSKIDYSWGRGAMELKTANYFANFNADQGAKLQYIFQHQFQMMVTGLKWGIVAVLMPKEKEFDEPFFKGKILERVENLFKIKCYSAETIDQFYDLHYYIYPALPVFQSMIMKALKAFQADLDAYDTDQSRFPRNSEDLIGLQREKKMWTQLWPEHYGIKQLDDEDELNKLFNERYHLQEAKMFEEQDFEVLNNQILQIVKQKGDDKYCEIRGTNHRLVWIKNGQVRFYKLG